MSLRIQPPMAPGRKLTIPFSFGYDSAGIHHLFDLGNGFGGWIAGGTYPASRGWSYILPSLAFQYLARTKTIGQPPETTTYTCHFTTDYVFQDGSGTPHALGLAQAENGTTCNNVSPLPVSQTDGGDLMVKAHTTNWGPDTSWPPLPVTVADPDGTVYYFQYSTNQAGTTWLPDYIEDSNGNKITVQNSGNGNFTFTDTAGRTLFHESGFGKSTSETVTVSNRSYVVNWNLSPPQYSYGVGSTVVQTAGTCNPPGPVSGTEKIITSIELPNTKLFSFTYSSTYGLISQVNYPSGGFVKYTWGLNANSEYGAYADHEGAARACQYHYSTPVVTERDVSFDGSTNYALTQTFTYSTTWSSTDPTQWTQKTTTVHTVDHRTSPNFTSDTTYVYSPMPTLLQPNEPGYMVTAVPGNYTASTTSTSGSEVVTKHFSDLFSPIYESVQKDGLTAVTTLSYAAGDQVVEKDENDYSGTLVRKTVITHASFPATSIYPTAPSILDRPSAIQTYDGGGHLVAETDYAYDQTGVSGASAIQHDDTNYGAGSGAARGNATTKTEGSSVTTYDYDDTGQMVSMTDPCGHAACADMTDSNHTTTYSYADDYVTGSQPPGQTNAYLTQITYPNTRTSHVERFAYYYTDGQLATSTDQNSQPTNYSYDSMERLTSASYPDSGLTTYTYNDSAPTPTMTLTRKISSSVSYVSTSTFDGMGHVTRAALTSDPDGTDTTDTTYNGSGQALCVSNPYRGSSSGNTCYTYDLSGRVTKVTFPDSSASTTTYGAMSGMDCGTTVDPAAKSNQVCSDALGRVMNVTDGLGNLTAYTYNALDDLTNVSQGGQPRAYGYNSLSQLTSASNPEEGGPTTYTYDANGNVATRTRPKANQTNANVTTTTSYTYDALNRLLSKTYPDGTPTVNFFYDLAPGSWPQWSGISFAYADGRMTAACTVSAAGKCTIPQTALVYSYDQMGRVANLWQCAPYNCGSAGIWSMPYTYDLAGDVTNYWNPAGFNVTQGINGAQRANSLTYGASMAVDSITYTPWGAISTMCGGQGCGQSQETRQYNSRLQPVLMELGNSSNLSADYSLTYSYTGSNPPCAATTGDNGNIMGATYTDNVNAGYSHTFTYCYDSVNRLVQAIANGSPAYNLAYSYDQYGNPSCVGGSGGGVCPALSYDLGKNHVTFIGGITVNYDAAGNQLNDQYWNYQYDAEGRAKLSIILSGSVSQCPAAGTPGPWQCPVYNALGQRVEDYQGDGQGNPLTLTYPMDIFGQRTGAFAQWPSQNWTGWNVYWSQIAGQRLNMGGADAYIDHSDAVGSTTMETDPAGAVQWDVTHYPWGRVFQEQGIRQSEVVMGLDWQVNDPAIPSATREYNFEDYRWMTPDLLGGRLEDPQTLNRYSYVRNNPTTLTDPLGLYVCADDPLCKSKQDVAFEKARQNDLLSKDANALRGAKAYGDPGKDNGVTVAFGDPGQGRDANTTHDLRVDPTNPDKFQAAESVTIRSGLSGSALDAAIGHEGSHVADAQDFADTITMGGSFNASKNLSTYQTELKAYMVTQSILSSENAKFGYGDCGLSGPCVLGVGIMPAQAVRTINDLLANPANRYGAAPHYGVTPANPGPVLYPALTVPH